MDGSDAAVPLPPRNKTLYVRAEDAGVWARAEALAGRQSISAVVTNLLRRWVDDRGMERIEVEVDDDDGRGRRKKAFVGRVLVTVTPRPGAEWTVYLTAKKQLAIYGDQLLMVYPDIPDMRRNLPQPEIVTQVQEALRREDVEELDI